MKAKLSKIMSIYGDIEIETDDLQVLEVNETFYYVDLFFNVQKETLIDEGIDVFRHLYKSGVKIFKTKEEAKEYADFLEILKQYRSKPNEDKIYIIYKKTTLEPKVELGFFSMRLGAAVPTFPTYGRACDFIEAVGEEALNKFYFN